MRFVMKTSLKSFVIFLFCLLVVGFAVSVFTTGCASTATSSSTGEYVDDSAITVKVKSALVKDPVVKALDVKVETYKGVVQLSGFVRSATEREQAGSIAAGIQGVTSVKNSIIVK